MATFVITHDGSRDWQWDKPSNVIHFSNSVEADAWKSRMETVGAKVVDDRGQPCGNVCD